MLGPFSVGDDVRIGAGSVVLKEIPSGCTVVGIPGQIVKRYGTSTSDMNQINLPDPIAIEMTALRHRIKSLESQLGELECMAADAVKEAKEDQIEDI